MSRVQHLVAQLAAELQLGEIPPNDDGVYSIIFDGNLEIEIAPMGHSRFLLRSRLRAVPDDDREAESLFRACLQRHLAQLHWSAAAVTWDKDSARLWLYQAADATALGSRAAKDLLEEFVNVAETWSRFEPDARPDGGLPLKLTLRP